jgi:hypothetical protein
VHSDAPAEEEEPAAQLKQLAFEAAPVLGLYVPARQFWHVESKIAPMVVLYLPD